MNEKATWAPRDDLVTNAQYDVVFVADADYEVVFARAGSCWVRAACEARCGGLEAAVHSPPVAYKLFPSHPLPQ